MKERIKKGDNEDLRYDWKGDLIAIFLMSIIAALFVVVWVYWTETQLGR
jgi:predicted negative regulator of RcsB-dependent stress response